MQMGSLNKKIPCCKAVRPPHRIVEFSTPETLNSHNSENPVLDCLFFSNGPTMNVSDFATMISRIVATPAAGVVNG